MEEITSEEMDIKEESLSSSLGEYINTYRRLLYDNFHVDKPQQLKTLIQEDIHLNSNQNKDDKTT